MLLDRRRINRWAKWVSLALAIVFGVSFLFLGIGSGANMDWGALWASLGGGSDAPATPSGPAEQIKAYEAALAANPSDANALLGIAIQYEQLGQPAQQAAYLEKYVVVKPGDFDTHMKLAAIYMSPDTADYPSAVRVLNTATSIDPTSAQAFLLLGSAQRAAGNAAAAILAWNKYLQLEPQGSMAETVKAEIARLAASSETTSTAPASSETTGTVSSTTTTAP